MNKHEKFEALLKFWAQKVAPWKISGEKSLPYNPISRNYYHALNALNLIHVAADRGYEGSNWLTFKQAFEAGGIVKKGEKGTQIQFWTEDESIDGLRVKLEKPRFNVSYVFHQEQIKEVDLPQITPFYTSPEASLDKEIYLEALRQKDPQQPIFGTREHLVEELRITMAQILVASRYGLEMEANPRNNRAFEDLLQEDPRELLRSAYRSEGIFKAVNIRWGQHLTHCGERLLNPAEMEATETIRAENNQKVSASGSWEVTGGSTWVTKPRFKGESPKIVAEIRRVEWKTETAETENNPNITTENAPKVSASEIKKEKEARTWLVVPYSEKEEAKSLARENGLDLKWDKKSKVWYVAGNGEDLAVLKKWLPENKTLVLPLSVEEEFSQALKKAGLQLTASPIMDGKLHRVTVEGDKPGQTSGAYAGYTDGHPAGYIENFKTGDKINWKYSQPVQDLTPQQVETQREEKDRRTQESEQEQQQLFLQNAATLKEALSRPQKPVLSHYLAEKDVKQHAGVVIMSEEIVLGGKIFARPGDLIIPVQNLEGDIMGCQKIESQLGEKSLKRFSPGTSLSGHFFPIGNVSTAKDIVIAEGYATAATLFEAADCQDIAVLAAFSANNLEKVATAVKERYPDKCFVIAADNDAQKERNTGLEKAKEAAEAIGAHLTTPYFKPDQKGTDWNDFARIHGKKSSDGA